jgi:small subunit ribosomal protein S20
VAHSLSAKKRIRQNVRRRTLNRARRSLLKSKLRKCSDLLLRGKPEEAESSCRATIRALDRAANQRTLHRNAAARRKSRLARRLNALKAAPKA